MKVIERYTHDRPRSHPYEATIDDPKTFTRPWKIACRSTAASRNAQLRDFKCVEFVEELMYGQWRKKPLPQ